MITPTSGDIAAGHDAKLAAGPGAGALLGEVGLVHARTRPSKSTLGVHPSCSRALVASPISRSTSAGRSKRGSWLHEALPVVVAGARERGVEELADGVGLAGRDHVVVGDVLLQHQPHRLDVVAGEAPVARGVEVAERDRVLQAELDPRQRVGDLAGDELEPALRDSRG